MQDNSNLNFIKMFRLTLKQGCVLHSINQLLHILVSNDADDQTTILCVYCDFFFIYFSIHRLADGGIFSFRKMLKCLNFILYLMSQ